MSSVMYLAKLDFSCLKQLKNYQWKSLCCKTKIQVFLKKCARGLEYTWMGVNHKSILKLETIKCLELEPNWIRFSHIIFQISESVFFHSRHDFLLTNKVCQVSKSIINEVLAAKTCKVKPAYEHLSAIIVICTPSSPPPLRARFEVNSVKTTLICSDFSRAWFTGRNIDDKKRIWNPFEASLTFLDTDPNTRSFSFLANTWNGNLSHVQTQPKTSNKEKKVVYLNIPQWTKLCLETALFSNHYTNSKFL